MQGDPAERYENPDPSDLAKLILPFNVNEVEPQCLKCVRRQFAKYNSYLDAGKKSLTDRFIVQCHGVLKQPINPKLKQLLSFEEYEEAERALNPVKWAQHYLTHPDYTPWDARPYQEEVMKCTSTRRALRISRRTGKCISEGSQVLTEIGSLPIEELYELSSRPKVVSFSEDTEELIFSEASIKENGIQPVFLLKTKNGRETVATDNHPFLVLTSPGEAKWKELRELKINDKIAVPSNYSSLCIKGVSVGERKARLLGYLIGDGGTSYKITVRFSNVDPEILADIEDILSDYECELNYIGGPGCCDYNIVGKGDSYGKRDKNRVNKIVTDEGLRCLAINKVVPKSILCGTKEDIIAFLGAYWDCDGWAAINKKHYDNRKLPNVEIGVGSSSRELMLQIKHLLLRLGISSSLRKKKVKYNGEYRWSWQVTMSGKESILKFRSLISLRAKQEAVDEVCKIVEQRKTRRLLSKEYAWDKVLEISSVGERPTYDLSVPETHTLVADDIISHNTDMVSVEIVWKLFTNKDRRIVVAAPQKVHTEEIFKRVRGFIYRNPFLANSVVKDVSSPVYELILQNGSYVMGFALGTRGKTEGLSVRGQNADDVYCDEMDYVDEKAIQGGLLPVLQTTDHTTMTGFSTPTGFKSVYYSFCEEMPEFREFHYNYKVLPHWKKVEADRGAYTEEEWIHEMLAEWGSSEEGVYKPSYVDRALKSYSYEEMTGPMAGWRYLIGVDWNEKHGAEICVIGENRLNGYYQVVEAFCVEKSEYTQIASVNAVLDANRKWKPAFIFVDAGNGSTNYEMLRKLSWDQRKKSGDRDTARIIDILRKYDSGASLQTKDPISGETRKAPAKPYMVNASVRSFENNMVRISSADKDLEKQFRNYIIERISPTGNPVYGMRDKKVKDHRLDAFNLAMVGFYLEFGGLQPQMAITSMAATVNPITKKLGTPRIQNPEPVSVSRGLEPVQGNSVLGSSHGAVLPARVNQAYDISHTNPGWATDEEERYRQMYESRHRGRKSLRSGNPVSRSNI